LNATIAKALRRHPDITHIVQVGDFGYGWPQTKPFKISHGYYETDELFERALKMPFFWLDGNHENHDLLEADHGASQSNTFYCPRGSVIEFKLPTREVRRAMFFGGASSIDKKYRIEGVTWWPQESITYSQTQRAIESHNEVDIVFSHERPSAFNYKHNFKEGFGESDKNALEAIREVFKPPFWCFGHYHDYDRGEHDGTQWVCCPIIDDRSYTIWDGDSLEYYPNNG